MSILITPTLLNTFDFYINVKSPEWKKKAWTDLEGTLKRSKTWDPSPAVLAGMAFEKAVYAQCERQERGGEPCGSKLFQSVVDMCIGGCFQESTKYFETIDGEEYCIYGKMDVTLPGLIIDIKTTGEFNPVYGVDKYLKGWQHRTYCVSKNINQFKYLVCEWESPEIFKPAKIHEVPYVVVNMASVKESIREKIKEFVAFTKANEETFGLYTALTTIFTRS